MIKLRSCIGAVVFASCIGPVAAQVTWTLTGGIFDLTNSATNYTVGTVSGVSLGLTAYANTRGDDSVANDSQTVEQQIGDSQGTGLATRRIGINDYISGGVGIVNKDGCGFTPAGQTTSCDTSEGSAPEDALDNNQRYEMILLSFGAKVSLTALNLGYVNTDSDMTIMAYTGSGNALTNLQNGMKTWSEFGAGITGAGVQGTLGWTALANSAGGTTTGSRTIASNGVSSSYWLIGAYNPLANPNGGTLNGDFDHMKVGSVSGNVVPEPGSLALLAAALLGMVAVRQRKKA